MPNFFSKEKLKNSVNDRKKFQSFIFHGMLLFIVLIFFEKDKRSSFCLLIFVIQCKLCANIFLYFKILMMALSGSACKYVFL